MSEDHPQERPDQPASSNPPPADEPARPEPTSEPTDYGQGGATQYGASPSQHGAPQDGQTEPTPQYGAPAYGQSGPPAYGQPSQPPPYQPGSPMPGYGPAPGGVYSAYGGTEHPRGVLILILGIVSIVLCQLVGPFAWVMGRRALQEIDSSGRTYTNRGMVQAGYVCGIIGTVLLGLVVIYLIVIVAVAISASTR